VTAVLLRHARAGDRIEWEGDDRLRPLDERGRRQAAELAELLGSLGIRRIVSSPYVRCVETVEPLAAALGLELELDPRLAEGEGAAGGPLLREDGVVACTHGDVVLELIGLPLKKGAAAIVEPDGDAGLRTTETIRPPKGRS
jgi:Histidine phosphatase superfamily (branch 1)